MDTTSSAFRWSSTRCEAVTHDSTISWCGQVLKDGGYRYVVWEESNPISVSGILGPMNALFLNASQGLAGAGVSPLAAVLGLHM